MAQRNPVPKQFACIALVSLILTSCATYIPKYADPEQAVDVETERQVVHTFYLIGDAGLSPMGGMNPVLERFRDRLAQADTNSTAVFLGDNIYPAGLPDATDSTQAYLIARNHLEAQLKTLDQYKGRPVFIPGNHDWYTEGIRGLKRQERYVEDYLDRKDVFLPEDGCPLETVEIRDDILLVTIDTEWYLTNWDRRPAINDDCEIKSREVFWAELTSIIKQNADKTVVLAVHHPMFSYGVHGGQYTFRQQFYPYSGKVPLPVLGTFINLFRKTAGVSVEDMQNKRYLELRRRLVTLSRFGERVVVSSGHEHTLQYIVEDSLPQIVSGSGAKKGATNLLGGSRFSTGMRGYAVLEVYEDRSSRVRYYGVNDAGREEFLFTSLVYDQRYEPDPEVFEDEFPRDTTASVYTPEEVDKSGLHTSIWGRRYREYYGTQVRVPVARLDTLYGGLTPVRKGGGQQSKSLRLRHESGAEYVMRAMRKQAEQNLQAAVFTDQYIMGQFHNTAPENLIEDLYTGAHPYAPFAINGLADTLGIYHTNPRLFYVPHQPALGAYNEDFGDELYMIEEHPSEGHEELESFGKAKDIESTYNLLDHLRDDEKYRVDIPSFIRARLFDMLIGDWDRHQDQWRWAEFEETEDSVVYRPIPRDRDQVFSILGDGLIGGMLTRLVPSVKKMEGFGRSIRNVRTFNTNPFSLDRALLGGASEADWLAQAQYIKQRITPEAIDRSFQGFPPEVRGETTETIKSILLTRLEQLDEIAREYHRVLQMHVTVPGTDKDDWFVVEGMADGGVRIRAYRIIGGEKQKKFFDRVLDPEHTREVWIYGLDDKDRFDIDMRPGTRIRVRIVGGLGKDTYSITSGKRTVIYDHKSKGLTLEGPGSARVVRTDDYQVNTYRPLLLSGPATQILPAVGFNPDDGMRIGIGYTHVRNGFRRNPFSARHTFNAVYYFATSGFDFRYGGEFANLFGNWNFGLDARLTSPNYSQNFFGFGNQSENPEDELGMDYNRVRMRILRLEPSLVWRGPLGGNLRVGLHYERIGVDETSDRFVNTFYQANGEESNTSFAGIGARYSFENFDNPAFPTLGMSSSLEAGFTQQLSETEQRYGYVIPSLSLDHRLVPSGRLVLATRWKAHFNIGNGYEFYQAAQMGAADGPRSYRNQRFSGKTAYYQLTDLRLQFREMRTGIVPVSLGLFGGFDYGRVWNPGSPSERWHTSYGGGIFLNGINVLNANFALFDGEDGLRFSFGLGFTF